MTDQRRRMIAEFVAVTGTFKRDVADAGSAMRGFRNSTASAFQDVTKHGDIAAMSLNRVKQAALALGAAATVGAFTSYADKAKEVANQLQAIGAGSDATKARVYALAMETRAPIESTVGLLRSLQKSLTDQPLDQTIRQVGTLNRLLAIGGLDGNARASVALQFGQALQSGNLAGDELRSLREAAPVELLNAIAAAAGGTITDLKRLGSEGKLTREVMVAALTNLEQVSKDKFGAFKMTVAEATEALRTGMIVAVEGLDKGLGASAALAGVQQNLGQFLMDNADAARTFGEAMGFVFEASVALAGGAGLMAVQRALAFVILDLRTSAGAAALSTRAFATLNKAMMFFGGPWALAIAAIGFALMVAKGDAERFTDAISGANESLRKVEALGKQYSATTDAINSDLALLRKAHDDVSKAIEGQGLAAQQTKRLEVAAIDARIAKNKELLLIIGAGLQAELQAAKEKANAAREALQAGVAPEYDEYATPDYAVAAGGPDAVRAAADQKAADFAAYAAEVDAIVAKGGELSEAQRKFATDRAELAELEKEVIAKQAAAEAVLGAARQKSSEATGDAMLAESLYVKNKQKLGVDAEKDFDKRLEKLTTEAEIQALINQYGEKSAVVTAARAAAERDAYEAAAKTEGITGIFLTTLMAAYDTNVALANVDTASGIDAAASSANALATQLGISLARAQAIMRMGGSGPGKPIIFDPREPGYNEKQAKAAYAAAQQKAWADEREFELIYTPPVAKKAKGTGGGGSGGAKDELNTVMDLNEARKLALDLIDKEKTAEEARAEQIKEITQARALLVKKYGEESKIVKDLDEATAKLKKTGDHAFAGMLSDMGQMILEGKKFGDILSSILIKFLQMNGTDAFSGLFSGGGFGDFVKTLFKAPIKTMATGGINHSPTLTLSAEAGMSEAFVPLPDGRSIPVTLSMPNLSKLAKTPAIGGGQMGVELHIHENAEEKQTRIESNPATGRIDVFLRKQMQEQINSGAMDGAMKARFGVGPKVR